MKTTVLFILAFLPIVSFAQFGVLDGDFDADGIRLIQASTSPTRGFDLEVQPDGKILVCGWASLPSGTAAHVTRLFPDGSLDNSFGVNGQTVLLWNAANLEVYNMALQDDGNIVLVGGIDGAETGQVVIRINGTDGFPDPFFGTDGFVLIPYTIVAYLYDVAIQSDGKIVAAGITAESDLDITVVRLNTDGTLDTDFSFDGKVVTDVDLEDWAQGLAIGVDGKITVAGSTSHPGGNTNGLLVRYNSDGTLDNSFGTNGKVELDVSTTVDEFHNLATNGSGSIFAVGATSNPGNQFLIAKYTSTGSLDNSFSFDGVVQTDFANDDDRAWDVIVQPDSRVLVVGKAREVSDKLALARYMPDGTLDNSFGTGGKVLTSNGQDNELRSVALQSDLKIVAVGTVSDAQFNQRNAIVARYTSGMNVGIGEVDAYIGSTLVYPNPITNNQVTVEYELNSDETVSIELFDLSGKRIAQLQPSVHQKAGSRQKTISLPAVSAGNYLLKLNTGKGSVMVRLTMN